MKKVICAVVLCIYSMCLYAQDIKISDNDYPQQKMRIIHSDYGTHTGWFDMEGVKSGRPSVRTYPSLSLHKDYLNAKAPKYYWYFNLRMISSSKIAFRKGARCLLKTQDGETITLLAESADEDYIGDYWGSDIRYSIFAQFEIKQAVLDKISNKKIVKIRFELVSEIIEFTDLLRSGSMPLNMFVKKAKDAIIERKNKKKDDLLDGF